MTVGDGFSAGSAWVNVEPRLDAKAGAAIEAQLDGPLGKIRSKFASLGKLGGLAIGAGLVAAAGAVFVAGKTMDEALDTVRIKTGLVGKEFDGMETTLKGVASRVPDSLGKVAEALSLEYDKTKLTGKALEDLTVKQLTLARLNKTDVASSIESTTSLFNRWGVATKDQSSALDFLFRVQQKTGTSIDSISTIVTKFATPLKEMGFSWKTASVLVGEFERTGVNVPKTLASMSTGLAKMAKAGQDPAAALRDLITQIQKAGTVSEANAIAVKIFGARGGPELAASIRSGKFSVDALVKSLDNGHSTIMTTAKATDHFGVTFDILKNKVLILLAPLGQKLVAALDTLAQKAMPVVDWIGKRLPGALSTLSKWLTPVWSLLKELWTIFGDLIHGRLDAFALRLTKLAGGDNHVFEFFKTLGGWVVKIAGWLKDHLVPVLGTVAVALGLIFAPVTTVILGFVLLYTKVAWFRDAVQTAFRWLADHVPGYWDKIASAAKNLWHHWLEPIVNFVKHNLIPVLTGFGAMVLAVVVPAFVGWAAAAIPAAAATLAAAAPIILIVAGIGLLVGALVYAYKHWTGFRNVVNAAAHGIATAATWLWDHVLKPVFGFIVSTVKVVATVVTWLWKNVFAPVFGFIGKLIQTWWTDLVEPVWNAFSKVVTWVVDHIVKPYFHLIAQEFKILGAVVKWLWENVIQPAWTGISAVISWAWDHVIQPIWERFKLGLKVLGPMVMDFWHQHIEPAFKGIGKVISWVWDHVISPAWDNLKKSVGEIKDIITDLWHNVFEPAWAGIGKAISWVWDNVIKPVMGFISDGFSGLVGFVESIVSLIIRGINDVIQGLNDVNPFGDIPKISDPFAKKDKPKPPTFTPFDPGSAPGGSAGMHPRSVRGIRQVASSSDRPTGPLIGSVTIPVLEHATSREVVDAVNAKLGWTLTTRSDG